MALTQQEMQDWQNLTGNPSQGSSWTDYMPNVFGSAPSYMTGLLGEKETQALQSRANIGGLLGSLGALAQGMSSVGPRRSAAQNILSALGAGYGSAGQVYQQVLENFVTQQKINQMQLQQAQMAQKQNAINQMIQDPAFANDPVMKAWAINSPDDALKWFVKRRGMQAFMAGEQKQPAPAVQDTSAYAGAVPSAEPISGDQVLPQTQGTVVAPVPTEDGYQALQQPAVPKVRPLEKEIAQADLLAKYWSSPEGDDPVKAKEYQAIANNLRGQQRQQEIVVNPAATLSNVHPTLQTRVATLNERAQTMTPDQVVNEQNDILKDDAKIKEELSQDVFNQKLKLAAAQGGILYETPEKKFQRTSDLRKEYSSTPIVKDFQQVQVAYNQINGALKNPSAAGDLAAATKFMKLLDPGSVVRESELGMAMAATGVLDKASNYYNLLKTGQKLTPEQRKDFLNIAGTLYKASENVVIPLQSQYRDLAAEAGVNPKSVVVNVPSGGPSAQSEAPAAVPSGVTIRKVR